MRGFRWLSWFPILLTLWLTVQEPDAWRLVTPEGHTSLVGSAVFSPDGRYVLTGSWDNTARIWEVTSGREVQRFTGHSSVVACASFSPDGRQVVTGSWDDTARIWDVASGRQLKLLKGHTSAVVSAMFSPDGRSVVTGSWDGTAAIWDVASGRAVTRFTGHTRSVAWAAFSPDGASIVTAGWDTTARIWDVSSGRELRRLLGHTGFVVFASFSPDGRSVVTASYDSTARIWEVGSGRQLRRLAGHTDGVLSAMFFPDGRSVLTSAGDSSARIWNAASGREVRRLTRPQTPGLEIDGSVSLSADGRFMVTSGEERTARVVELATGKEVARLTGHANPPHSVGFAPDGRSLVTANEDGTIGVWETASGREVQRFRGHGEYARSARFSPDGQRVVTAGADSTARVWDVATGRELRRFVGHGATVHSAAFSPDGGTVVTAGDDGTARIWEVSSGREVQRFVGHRFGVVTALFSPDGRLVVTAGAVDSSARIWDVASGKELQRLTGAIGRVWSAAFSPDGRLVATMGDFDGIIWETASGREVRRIPGVHYISPVTFSPDGSSVVTGSHTGTASMWAVVSGREVRRFSGHSGAVESAELSPDGRWLVTASEDGSTRIWDSGTGRELFRRIALDSSDWVVAAPDGRFDGTERGMRSMHYARALSTIALDAFFESFYTPGVAGQALAGDPYAGPDIRKGFGLAPSVSILSPRTGDTVSANATVTVAVRDEGGGAQDVRLYTNGALVGGSSRGVDPKRSGCPATATCFQVDLLPGTNILEATAFSTARVAAERARVTVTVPGSHPAATLHLLVVGINDYQNPRYSLNYGRPDAKAFVDSLLAGGRGIFSAVAIDTLYDSRATGLAIKAAFRRVALLAKPQDLFVFFYAGHGIAEQVGDSTRFYLVPSDVTQMSDAEQLAQRAIANLQALFDAVPARKKLMLIDACQSGQVLAAFAQRGAAEEQAIARLARASGIFVMSATGSDQQASEVATLGHGVFTYAWLMAMAGEKAGPRERLVGALASEVERTIPELSRRYRSEPQYPIVFRNGQDFPLIVR